MDDRPTAWPDFDVEPLDEGTAGQILTLLGKRRIQVSASIARGELAAVAQHVGADHQIRCSTRDCAQARAWLADRLACPARAAGGEMAG